MTTQAQAQAQAPIDDYQQQLVWYPGHCYLETALFGRDTNTQTGSSRSIKLLKHVIHKRNFPNSAPGDRIEHLDNTEIQTSVTQPLPAGSLQLIRFVGLGRQAPENAETRRDRQVLASVFKVTGFPVPYVATAFNSPRVEQGRLFAGDESDIDGGRNPAFYATGSRICLIWRFDTATKSTRVVFVNYAPPSVQLVTGFMPALESAMHGFRQCFGHPMFMSLLLVSMLRLDAMSTYDQDSNLLNVIEGRVTVQSASRIGTMQQLRDLGRLIGHDKFVMFALRTALEQARRFNERTYVKANGGNHFADPIAQHFLARLEHQHDLVETDLVFLETRQQNISHQLTAISTIVNLRDTTSMKTIAVITMAFLPGTFLASIFAMPIFPQTRHDQFWLYWAICLPLTAVVFLAWLTWYYSNTMSQNRSRSDGDDLRLRGNFLNFLESWFVAVNSPSESSHTTRTDRNSFHDFVQKRLAGDTYSEWIKGFNNLRTNDEHSNTASRAGIVVPSVTKVKRDATQAV